MCLVSLQIPMKYISFLYKSAVINIILNIEQKIFTSHLRPHIGDK